ncbi:hypothetical protein DFH07DRAFT_803714 [Mycena maculata]|uniref:Uncharacterized protein n=1 Tax=Mycena maculata TaxID=230809 RepID=A0AAD7JUJ5_9AGAR|nr:hypothetical protein DFH07DRAFT_803714 [Mycena maculata]
MVLVLLFIFLRLRKSTREAPPFHDIENSADQDLPPAAVPFGTTTPESGTGMSSGQYPSEKSLPVLPTGPQVSPDELQNVIDRIQEMYAIMREMQTQTSGGSENSRVLELQRQIEGLMVDNAVLSGEQPPEYESERASSVTDL